MDIKSRYSNKLSNILFITLKKEKIKSFFNMDNIEEFYIPLNAEEIIKNIKMDNSYENLSLLSIMEGMIYVLGIDKNFIYNNYYIEIIKNNNNAIRYIKGKIAEAVSVENFEKAYILLLGFMEVEESKDIFDKLFLVLNFLRSKNKSFNDDMFEIIKRAKNVDKYLKPYLEEAIINNDLGEYEKAFDSLNQYLKLGGEQNQYTNNLKSLLSSMVRYRKGKELVYENPKDALELLIPLQDFFNDNALLLYYIAICYRILNNYEKAIYYLNDAMTIDNSYIEFLNELGLNYSCLGNYEKALTYFNSAFKVTNSIEICTNIIICYIELGDIVNARQYLNIAKEIKPDDNIIKEIENSLNK